MSCWSTKRFWKSAKAEAVDGGFTVLLDNRKVKTPAKAEFLLPSLELASAAASEWNRQEDAVDPTTMPITRAANAAIDKVSVQFDEVAAMLAEYGDSDLTCYRAETPEELVQLQARAWDPLLNWADKQFSARLIPVQGVVHIPQPEDALTKLSAPLTKMSVFELTAMHDLVSLTGSLVIGLATEADAFAPETLWQNSRIDEDWQISLWGEDEEANLAAQAKKAAFFDAVRFLELTRGKAKFVSQ